MDDLKKLLLSILITIFIFTLFIGLVFNAWEPFGGMVVLELFVGGSYGIYKLIGGKF